MHCEEQSCRAALEPGLELKSRVVLYTLLLHNRSGHHVLAHTWNTVDEDSSAFGSEYRRSYLTDRVFAADQAPLRRHRGAHPLPGDLEPDWDLGRSRRAGAGAIEL